MKNVLTRGFLFFAILFSTSLLFTACSSSDDNDDILPTEEETKYNEYVTPELDAALKKLGMPIHRGSNPPNIEGFYFYNTHCVSSTMKDDYYVNTDMTNIKHQFHNQNGLNIDATYYEFSPYINNFLIETHIGKGSFISGSGDNFSVFFNEEINRPTGENATTFSVFSGQLDRNESGTVVGIKNFRFTLLMRENNGFSSIYMGNGEGRSLEGRNCKTISEEEFNKGIKSVSNEKRNINSSHRSIMSIN